MRAARVLAPPIVWTPLVSTPPLLPSAAVRVRMLPEIVAPLALAVPEIAPTLVTPAPLPSMLAGFQALPFQTNSWAVALAMVTPYIVNGTEPMLEI